MSCSCRPMVCVEMTIRQSRSAWAAKSDGTRYAKLFPTPVPASTIRCRLAAMARPTASAIANCCGRLSNCGSRRATAPPGPRIDAIDMSPLSPAGGGRERAVADSASPPAGDEPGGRPRLLQHLVAARVHDRLQAPVQLVEGVAECFQFVAVRLQLTLVGVQLLPVRRQLLAANLQLVLAD